MTPQFSYNPMAGNPFRTRSDAVAALKALSAPLMDHFSEGCGRLRLGAAGAHFHEGAADLEGLTRPLWGIAPLLAGGGSFEGIAAFVTGLENGANPDHPDFWGLPTDHDQRVVESAAIGFAICLAPETFWNGLSQTGQDNLAAWLLRSLDCVPAPNNWHFFHVLVAMGLDRVGVPYDRAIIERDLDVLEAMEMPNGWYRDGQFRRAEHYIPFAMHFYGLIHAAYSTGHGQADAARAERFRARARDFAPQVKLWYADDGAALPYGRSLTYRFAHAGFWAGLALADVEALPWAEIRGYWARNLRYWASLPMADRDGVMGVGYGYPNLLMAENYNSPGSPYWAFKAFAPLALPESHPFWQAQEADYRPITETVTMHEPGMIRWEETGNVTVLTGGQEALSMRHSAEKYNKFAYSTRYGFSIEPNMRGFDTGALDNMLAFSEDGRHFAVRETEIDARIGDGYLYSAWSPMNGVRVETWLIAAAPWHLRIHRIETDRRVQTREGGFAIRRLDVAPEISVPPLGSAATGTARKAFVATPDDLSTIVDLGATIRSPRVLQAEPNSNVIFPRSWVPQLSATLAPGTAWLTSAVLARSRHLGDPGAAPDIPDETLLIKMRDDAAKVGVWDIG